MLQPNDSLPQYLLSDIEPNGLSLSPSLSLSTFFTLRFEFNPAQSRSTLSPKSRGARKRGISFQMMRKVVARLPIAFQPHKQAPSYLLVYIRETLSCGHIVHTFPLIDPLVAVRRNCQLCDEIAAKKNPAVSVPAPIKTKSEGTEQKKKILES